MSVVRLFAPALMACMSLLPLPALGFEGTEVRAVGTAFVAGPADLESAKRRALIDALVSAGLSSGAEVRGHSAVRMSVVTADQMLLRATSQVRSHRITKAELRGDQWTVEISAIVAPLPVGVCASGQELVVTAEPPVVKTSPLAPAWIATFGTELSAEMLDQVDAHPRVTLDRVIASVAQAKARTSDMDYLTLTRGRPAAAAGDHILRSQFAFEVYKTRLTMTLEIWLTLPDRQQMRHVITREAKLPQGGVRDLMTGRARDTVEKALTKGLWAEVAAIVGNVACTPAAAHIRSHNGRLLVPFGTRHGLKPTDIAFVDDPVDGFDLLEITSISGEAVTLRPLDPGRDAAGYVGRRVYFLEAGL